VNSYCYSGRTYALRDAQGFSLFSVLLWISVLLSIALILGVQITSQALVSGDIERQLYSLVLACNGIEYSRSIIPALRLTETLQGPDGEFQGTGSEWRNPVSYDLARSFDPESWSPSRDDGLPPPFTASHLNPGYRAVGGGHFFLRFSNNPEEPAETDLDHVVIVRSMGVVPCRLTTPFLPGIRNSVSLVEARFRQEVTFALPSPLTLFGDTGDFSLEGNTFLIDGSPESPGVSIVALNRTGLDTQLRQTLSADQISRVCGLGNSPSIQDATEFYKNSATHSVVYATSFWKRFRENLPSFANSEFDRIQYFPLGGTLESDFSGLLVAQGSLTLRALQFRGLLLHLGGGTLSIEDGASVEGAIWMSNLIAEEELGEAGPIQLRIRGRCQLRYSPAAIEKALRAIPPTPLGWRILFPEMPQ